MESIAQGFWSFLESSPEGFGFYAGWLLGAILQTLVIFGLFSLGGKKEEELTQDQKTLFANLMNPLRDISTEWETRGDYILMSEDKGPSGKESKYLFDNYNKDFGVDGKSVAALLTKRQQKEILKLAKVVYKRAKQDEERVAYANAIKASK